MIAKDKKSGDMSVEDILKSIKGIINGHSKSEPISKNLEHTDQEVLELTNIIKEGKKERVNIATASEDFDNEHTDDYLISEKSANVTSNLFKDFARRATITAHEGKKAKNLIVEGLVIEMMKPQIKKWLDENLPEIVQGLVEKEIKRLVPDEQ